MAEEAQLYTLLYCTIGGKLLTEEGSMTVRRSTNSIAVATVAKGYAGESPGAAMVEIDIENAVPAAGFEYDAGDDMEALNFVELGCIGPGGKQLVARGAITEDSLQGGVNAESKYSLKFRGAFQKYE